MTVATTQITETWTGDASSVTFPIPFPFLSRDHLVVWKEDSGGAQTTMTIESATGEGEPSGGSITLTEPVGVGYTLHVLRSTPRTQETDYVPHDPFPAESHERALDKLTMIVQELIASTCTQIDVSKLRDMLKDSKDITWSIVAGGVAGAIEYPLTPGEVAFADLPASSIEPYSGGAGYGSDSWFANIAGGAASTTGIRLGYAGSVPFVEIGDIGGTKLTFRADEGGSGVDAFGYGAFKFGSLRVGDLAGGDSGVILPMGRDNDGDIVPRTASEFRGDIDVVDSSYVLPRSSGASDANGLSKLQASYMGNSGLNRPYPYSFVQTFGDGISPVGRGFQLGTNQGHSDPLISLRICDAGIWGPWKEIWDTVNLAVTAFAKTILDDADAASVRATIGVKERAYAQIYRTGAGVAQSIPTGTAWTKVTPFNANDTDYTDSTPDHTNDQITIGRAGRYRAVFSRSYDVGTANTTWKSTILKNGSEWVPATQQVKELNASTSAYACTSVEITCAAGDVLSVAVQHDSGGSVNITFPFATFSVEAID